jgi:hypothetical protein
MFAVIGLCVLPAAAWVGVSALALQFLLYLSYAHPAFWSVYYSEGAPLLAFLSAVGVAHAVSWAARRRAPSEPARGLQLATTMLAAAAMIPLVLTARQVRAASASDHAYHADFARRLDAIQEPRAVVFIRYGPRHNDGLSLVHNEVDLGTARVWTAYDRGGENDLLLRLAPERTPYLFDEESGTLSPIQQTAQGARNASTTPRPERVSPAPRH